MAIGERGAPARAGRPVSEGAAGAGLARRARRRQLIEATMTSIATHGLSRTTVAKVAKLAGLSPGIVSFYFASKDALLLETLAFVIGEYDQARSAAIGAAGDDPAAQLDALIEASFDPVVSDPTRAAVWYAFWSEVRARTEYLKLCGDRDAQSARQVRALCRRLAESRGLVHLDADAIAFGLIGMIEWWWQAILARGAAFDRERAKRKCRAFLASVFPGAFEPVPVAASGELGRADARARPAPAPETLPAWTYDNAEFHALERAALFRRNWQLVGHLGEVRGAGDYATLEVAGARAFVIRGADGRLRAFHNVCRHRAHALVGGAFGHCRARITCPYHGWSYDLAGRLKAIANPKTFHGLDKRAFGLAPLDLEVFHGFVFVRFEGAGPSVADAFGPFDDELDWYRIERMEPLGGAWDRAIAADWKTVIDNYLEGYHLPASHPGLRRLFGRNLADEFGRGRVARSLSWLGEEPSRNWSERAYQRLLPVVEHLPEARRRAWVYHGFLPNHGLELYPEMVAFFQVLPEGPGRCRVRARAYGLPDAPRAVRVARYLNERINRRVQEEDERIVASVQGGLASGAYPGGVYSDLEGFVRRFHDLIRATLPVSGLAQAPAPGRVGALNDELARADAAGCDLASAGAPDDRGEIRP